MLYKWESLTFNVMFIKAWHYWLNQLGQKISEKIGKGLATQIRESLF